MLFAMLRRPLRLLVLVLVGLAFLGGTTLQALPPSSMAAMAEASVAAMPDCAEMAGMAQDTGVPAAPMHKGITPDCVKMTQCLGVPDLPVQPRLAQAAVTYVAVAYWSPDRRMAGRSPSPTPFPPRSA